MTTTTFPPPIVEFVLDGPADAATVAAGKCAFLGLIASTADGLRTAGSFAEARDLLTQPPFRHRVYTDAVHAQVVERRFGLPPPDHFDDLCSYQVLLTGSAPDLERERGSPRPGGETAWQAAHHRVEAAISMMTAEPFASLEGQGLQCVYERIERPLTTVTADMIYHGVPIDRELLAEYVSGYAIAFETARAEFRAIAGKLNPLYAAAVQRYFYDELGIPCDADGAQSLKLDHLYQFAPQCPAVAAYCTFKHLQPLHSFLDELAEASHGSDVVHPRLDALGTATGRYTAAKPNLLAIPAELRCLVRARPGAALLEADFSQKELRVLAQLSGDPTMTAILSDPAGDIHRSTAALVLAKSSAAVTADERERFGKAINFAIIYGMSEIGLARSMNVSVHEASGLIESFFYGHPRVREWLQDLSRGLGLSGELRTLYGRRRAVGGPGSRAITRGNQIANSVIQGTAADIFKLSLLRLSAALPASSRIVLPLHDAVLIEAPEEEAREVAQIVRNAMQSPPPHFTVPLFVKVSVGNRWADLSRVDVP